MIYLYNDNLHYKENLLHRLKKRFGPDKVVYIDAAHIIEGVLGYSDILVMPGGSDTNYCKKLNGEGNRRIREFIEGGGRYLGFCAGAYYGSREICWAKDTPKAISGPRELSLIETRAKGPERSLTVSLDKSWYRATALEYQGGSPFLAIYAGGPIFEDAKDCEILARYADLPGKPPAIIGKEIGKGYVVLCSPHLEIEAASYLKAISRPQLNWPEWSETNSNLTDYEEEQERAWNWLMDTVAP